MTNYKNKLRIMSDKRQKYLIERQGLLCGEREYRTKTSIRSSRINTNFRIYNAINTVLIIIIGLFVDLSQQQSSISLNNAEWFVTNSNGSLTLPARVPGGIYTDLRRNNILKQDILVGKNDLAYRWVGNENWTYTTYFAIDHQIARSQAVRLVLHGVDTISTIYLNGQEIGSTDNMFVRYKFDIKPHLKLAGLQNSLTIKFESPVKYSARKSNQSIRRNRGRIIPPYCPTPAQRGECHVNFIRKMQASFSWDWGPAFPSMGIYKNIDIEFGSFGIIRDILVETKRSSPLIPKDKESNPPPQVIISSNIRHQVRTPTLNRTMPYIRAPPYYMPPNEANLYKIDGTSLTPETYANPIGIRQQTPGQDQLFEETWLLKATLVAEMVKPSFGYNLRVEFSLNGVLHYESEHINVVANSEGFIRLGFNLRIDPTRFRIKPWWPNNAGGQTMYRLTAKMMPVPNASTTPVLNVRRAKFDDSSDEEVSDNSDSDLVARDRKPPVTRVSQHPGMFLLATQHDASNYNLQHVSEKEITFGFRSVELVQEPVVMGDPEEGLTFNFRINGEDLFAMGSNWIPASVLPENSNDIDYIKYLLQSAKDANMNMLRVWGGGIYESDEFYRLADEMGIMIWHDFMFACALYPVDDDFLASVRLEIEQQVQRLQHHPSIVIWAGNNENEMAIAGPWWADVMLWNKKLREDYSRLYTDTIKPIVTILDPTRPFVESSPSNGPLSVSQPNGISKVPNDNRYGDVHHYDYFANSFEWTSFPSTRFASEYGYQSYPSFNALTSVTTPNDWKYPLSPNILHRQHRMTGEMEIKYQIRLHFKEVEAGGIDKFKSFIYLSQLTQAIGIKTETEFYRRNRFINQETKLGKTMGALYWQLNDVWQAPTWSSIEYGGKWKMLHYFARRFFFPIQVMPYLIQPPANQNQGSDRPGSSAQISNISRNSSIPHHHQLINDNGSFQPLANQPPQPSHNSPTFVVDLVRDDLFQLLDSFNVSIRLFRWTSFNPIWQDNVYIKHTRPQNVTRIYELDLGRMTRQFGSVSLSSCVFQILIEQQPRLGLSQIENYLMPVKPSKVTAMRVAKISIELIQGPFELADVKAGNYHSKSSSHQWSCAYRLTLVTDSIAMFVWLDLNLMNIALPQVSTQLEASIDANRNEPPKRHDFRSPPDNIHLDTIPGLNLSPDRISLDYRPEHVRLHSHDESDSLTLTEREVKLKIRQPLGPIDKSENKPINSNKHQGNRSPNREAENGEEDLRYQFSDNAFNMFEPSKIVDLYLNRCLTKSQVEIALEIQSLSDVL